METNGQFKTLAKKRKIINSLKEFLGRINAGSYQGKRNNWNSSMSVLAKVYFYLYHIPKFEVIAHSNISKKERKGR